MTRLIHSSSQRVPVRSSRKRALIISVASLFLMGASLTTSALGSTGTTSASVSAAATNFIYPIANNLALPAGVSSLAYTLPAGMSTDATSHISTITSNGAALPSWAPTYQSAGSVTHAGDLALVNGAIAANGIVVSMYVTNLASLQQDYSSFAFPVDVWVNTCVTSCPVNTGGVVSATTGWTQDTAVVPSLPTYLTSTTGFITFNLPAGLNTYYDIAIDTGGSYYCTSLLTTGTASLTPTFYFTAEPY